MLSCAPFLANAIIVACSILNNLIPVALFVAGMEFFMELVLIYKFKPMDEPTDNFSELFVRLWKMSVIMGFM